ncbi:hypothetical protein ABG768_003468, partial [Culter alburnus]
TELLQCRRRAGQNCLSLVPPSDAEEDGDVPLRASFSEDADAPPASHCEYVCEMFVR